ncbi:hypothetical protein TrVE_jg12574 [Triparma verrucosa]|uniref:Endonuclease/exonuclease/phosphatase domain-containing protein n=1 Tax=Triparma verrucosa TaxID=1606542 RepID=A0A9W7FJL2_9STRA|nr:hypothetical protein TrVE_jg12574 [Triparma verrucosa]
MQISQLDRLHKQKLQEEENRHKAAIADLKKTLKVSKEKEKLNANLEKVLKEKEELSANLKKVLKEKKELSTNLGKVLKENETLIAKLKSKEELSANLKKVSKEKKELSTNLGKVLKEKETLIAKLKSKEELEAFKNKFRKECEKVSEEKRTSKELSDTIKNMIIGSKVKDKELDEVEKSLELLSLDEGTTEVFVENYVKKFSLVSETQSMRSKDKAGEADSKVVEEAHFISKTQSLLSKDKAGKADNKVVDETSLISGTQSVLGKGEADESDSKVVDEPRLILGTQSLLSKDKAGEADSKVVDEARLILETQSLLSKDKTSKADSKVVDEAITEVIETPFAVPSPDNYSSLTVLSWNVHSKNKSEKFARKLESWMREEEADVLCLQEVSGGTLTKIREVFTTDKGYTVQAHNESLLKSSSSVGMRNIIIAINNNSSLNHDEIGLKWKTIENDNTLQQVFKEKFSYPPGFLHATVKGGWNLCVCSVHTPASDNEKAKEELDLLFKKGDEGIGSWMRKEECSGREPHITIVIGDFNWQIFNDSSLIDMVVRAGKNDFHPCMPLCPTTIKSKADAAWFKVHNSVEVVEAGIKVIQLEQKVDAGRFDTFHCSDHQPIRFKMEWRSK